MTERRFQRDGYGMVDTVSGDEFSRFLAGRPEGHLDRDSGSRFNRLTLFDHRADNAFMPGSIGVHDE
ncbi:hypothetical protein ACIBG7_34025 [Nonomuraea sp. NPDC050328]|uniref:hypothetical protein n=1 Tax=Nonomuraea sp. NPDC050328 TaxID=3364361 RepID=UPI0037B77865